MGCEARDGLNVRRKGRSSISETTATKAKDANTVPKHSHNPPQRTEIPVHGGRGPSATLLLGHTRKLVFFCKFRDSLSLLKFM